MGALTLALALAVSASARPLVTFDKPETDNSPEVQAAQARIDEIIKQIERKEIPPIEFEFDKYVLKPHSKIALENVARVMMEAPNLKLMVFGHTCDIGTDEYNRWLSQKRAEAVKDYLLKAGMMGESIMAKGFGESRPLYRNEDGEASRSKNRRVEFVVTTRWWESVY